MRFSSRLGLVLCALLAFAPARADNTADEADVAFQLGNDAYARRQYQQALSSYFLSYRLVPNQNVLFNIARCYEALKRFDEAYRYYNDLAGLELPPEDRREVAAALARNRPKVALVKVVTEPPGAEVFVDREDLGSRGRAPQTLALSPGRHLVRVKKEGYHPAEGHASLSRGREVVQTFKLRRVVGSVSFTGSPEGAIIKDAPDGPALARLPATLELPPGKRIFYLQAPGHLPAQLLVDVVAEGKHSVPVALVAQPAASGKVIVTANRENALVRVDGKEAGFTPTVLLLPEGEHLLEISMRELKTFRKTLRVTADQEQRVHAELRYAPPPVQAASKSELSADEAPASITVITADEIRAFGYQTLAEALAAVRGTFLSDDRMYTYLGIRGFSPPGDLNTRVLILWDGHAMNDVWAGQGYAARDLSVDLDEVERIEIVRGPGSALYGTGAFFAVINVVPRGSLEERSVELRGGAGALSSWRGHLASGLAGEGRSLVVSFSGFGAAGAELTDLGERGRAVGLDEERAYNGTARARLGGLSLSALVNHREKDIPTAPFDTGVDIRGTRVLDTRAFAELRYDRELGKVGLSARAYFDATRYRGFWARAPENEGDPIEVQEDAGRADWVGGEARLRFTLFEGNRLTAGLESQLQLRIDQEVFGGGDAAPLETIRRTLLSAYVLDEWRVHPRLSLTAGLRLDKYLDQEELPITPRLGLVARPYERGLTKLVAGTAFRAPNVYELYYGDNNVTQRPAEKLSAETITTLELEHAHELNDELTLTAAGYMNRISNLIVLGIDPDPTPRCGEPVGTAECYVNGNAPGLVRAWGAEAALRWQPGRFTLVDLSYSFVSVLGEEQVGSTAPVHLVAGRLLLPLGDSGLRLATQATYQSPRGQGEDAVGEALLVSVGLSGEAGPLSYLASVRNLLDARYTVPGSAEVGTPEVPQYGRTFLLELGVRY